MLARSAIRSMVAAGFMAMSVIGCGGTPSYDVSGNVSFDGKPIPVGKIYFSPDTSKGNTGATGFANIKDGVYNTSGDGGKSRLTGPMIVKIEGFDPAAEAPNDPADSSGEITLKSLFPTYETTADLPKGNAKKDFDVPAEAAKRTFVQETSAGAGP